MRIKTNLPKAVVYREASVDSTAPTIIFRPTALPSSDNFIKVVYKGGHFVAIGENGSIAYSVEGQTWVVKKLGDYTFCDIEYIDDKYVIAGSADGKGLLLSSVDLVDWVVNAEVESENPSAFSLSFYGIWHNGKDYIVIAIDKSSARMKFYSYIGENLSQLNFTTLINDSSYSSQEELFLVKGNNRVAICWTSSATRAIFYTADGINFASSSAAVKNQPIFFYEGYFLQGIEYTASYSIKYAYLHRSINLNDWDIVSALETASQSQRLPYFICALRINDYSLYLGDGKGLLLKDGDALTEKTTDDCFYITTSATIKSAACSSRRIVCVGKGGIVFSANIDATETTMEISPGTSDQEIYIRKSDNIRMLHVKAVTRAIDPNIKPENLKKDITVLGVKGTYGG